jgi:hypothetical protein
MRKTNIKNYVFYLYIIEGKNLIVQPHKFCGNWETQLITTNMKSKIPGNSKQLFAMFILFIIQHQE